MDRKKGKSDRTSRLGDRQEIDEMEDCEQIR
jgi:hypothetical protein